MILILSRRSDYSTNKVIDWLAHFKAPYFRLNDEDLADGSIKISFNIIANNYFLKNDNVELDLEKIKVVWFRKFGFLDSYNEYFEKNEPTSNLIRFVYSEFYSTRNLLISILKDKKWLYFKDNMLSKTEILKLAKNNGLSIPKTIITSDISSLNELFSPHDRIITKAICEATTIKYKRLRIPLSTKIVCLSELKDSKIFPSLFQEYIEKEYELRIFYLDGIFYSMAMFTQNNEKTQVDYRNYDLENPIRSVPYKLPKEIELKLDSLMKQLGINTGSFDLIKSLEGDYVFLEVNPSGQYGMVAYPCNYPIDKSLAVYLNEKLN